MKQNYDFCLKEVLKSEGGYTNDPRDPGGPTNFGITLADYRAYINRSGTAVDVKNMTIDQAKTIYKSKYWDKVNGDNLPSGVDYSVFDYGVNSGVSRALRIFNKYKQSVPVKCINQINDERLSFLQALPTWSAFGKGWGSRVARVRHDSITLASKTTPVANAGAAVAVGAGGAMAYFHEYWPYGLAAIAVAGLVWLGIWYFERKPK